jgi:protein associated with RNAse G/E
MFGHQQVTVISRKFDLSIRRSWECGLVTRKSGLLVLVGVFGEAVTHSDLGNIAKGTVSFEYYWLDRWFNVFRFYEPSGELRNYYCNINMPPKFDGITLDYVDLDIDLVVWPDGVVETLDEDDFAENAKRFNYPDEVVRETRRSVNELKQMIAACEFPFENL